MLNAGSNFKRLQYATKFRGRMIQKKRIGILMHENLKKVPNWYFVNLMANFWQEDNHEIKFLFGTENYIPADILFVHVDLSVVPEAYLNFAHRYPTVINGRVKDIRKSAYSKGILSPGDNWDGPVIVKSDLNYAGRPELRHDKKRFVSRVFHKLRGKFAKLDLELLSPSMQRPRDYIVYDHLQDVPRLYLNNPNLIIQKFKPEIEDGLYCVRFLMFLGDRMSCIRLKSKHPVVNTRDIEDLEVNIEPHEKMVALREKYHLDYGKFDYVMVDNQPFLLDINKTIGRPHPNERIGKEMAMGLRDFSTGLYSYLN